MFLRLAILSLSFGSAVQAFSSQEPNAKNFRIESFFNHRETDGYQDPYRKIPHQGDDFESIVVNEIRQARQRVWVAVYELRLPKVAQALVQAKKKGVDVRIVLEEDNNWAPCLVEEETLNDQNPYATSTLADLWALIDQNKDGHRSKAECLERDAIFMLQFAGIPVVTDGDSKRGGGKSSLMHHKFVIIDQSELLVSSANFTLSDVHGDFAEPQSVGNANALLKIQGASRMLKAFESEFLLMWQDKSFSTAKPARSYVQESFVKLQFSPRVKSKLGDSNSTTTLIESELKNAKTSVDVAQFVFSEQKFTDALNPLLAIRVVVDPGFATRYYSGLLDLWGVERLGPNCAPQVNNRVWEQGIGQGGAIPTLNRADKLHHKFAVIDGETTIFGSHNWTEAAATKNDETLLILKDSRISRDFTLEMDRIYRSAKKGIPRSLPGQIAQEQRDCHY